MWDFAGKFKLKLVWDDISEIESPQSWKAIKFMDGKDSQCKTFAKDNNISYKRAKSICAMAL